MAYLVCVEEAEDRWIAHVPDLPGCFTWDEGRDVAIQAVPDAVEDYIGWAKGHGLHITGLSAPMQVSEVIRAWEFEDGKMVQAFFATDRPPLISEELQEYEALLEATLRDLAVVLDDFNAEAMGQSFPNERWTIAGVIEHIARAEWWYLDRLGLAFPQAEMPSDPIEAVMAVHQYMLSSLDALVERSGVVTIRGEAWSSRKVLRRTLWHRRDHHEHLLKLRKMIR
jgi:predicted RNase H-like HicB family nuclease